MKAEHYKKILDELIELIDEGIYIVDKDGVGIHYNKAMADMEKVNVSDVQGKKFHEAFPDFSMGESTMFNALKKNTPTIKKQQTYKNLYGKEITTVNSTVPIIVDGETVAALEVAKDITSIRQMSDTLLELQEGALEHAEAQQGNRDKGIKRYTFDDIYGQNPQFTEVVERARRAADNDASVFIYGETGTGKELFAQSIHYGGKRADKPFLAQNCAAIPETLLRVYCSEPPGEALPELWTGPGFLSRPTAEPCFWTKSAPCLTTFRASCCESFRRATSDVWAEPRTDR